MKRNIITMDENIIMKEYYKYKVQKETGIKHPIFYLKKDDYYSYELIYAGHLQLMVFLLTYFKINIKHPKIFYRIMNYTHTNLYKLLKCINFNFKGTAISKNFFYDEDEFICFKRTFLIDKMTNC